MGRPDAVAMVLANRSWEGGKRCQKWSEEAAMTRGKLAASGSQKRRVKGSARGTH